MSKARVIVVGSGIAGLSSALTLARAGAKVTLLEADHVLGGRIATRHQLSFEHEGRAFTFPLDHGIHGVWRQYRNLIRLLESTTGIGHFVPAAEQELIVPASDGGTIVMEVGARLRESLLPDVLMPAALLSQRDILKTLLRAGVRDTSGIARRLFLGLAFDPATEIALYDHLSVEQMIGTWPPLIKRLFSSLTHSAFFREPAEVSLSAFFTGLWCYVYGDKRDTAFDLFPADGKSAVVDPLVEAIEAHGGSIRRSTRAEQLEVWDGKAMGVHVRDDDKGAFFLLSADAVVLALDPPGFARVLAQSELQENLFDSDHATPEGLPSSSVRLFYTKRRSPGRASNGVFSGMPADTFFWLEDIHAPFRPWKDATGGAVLECHLYGDRANWAVQASDREIIESVRTTAERSWPEIAGGFVRGHVTKNPATHVAFGPGIMSRLPPVQTRVPNLAIAGDWVQTPWPTLYMERACLTGLLAARQIAPSIGLDPGAMPEPLPPHPRAPNVQRAHELLRRLRDRGFLGRLEG